MGVPTSEVGYTPATPRREDHEVQKGHVVALDREKENLSFRTDPARKLYAIYRCCVYSEKLLMMDGGTVRNM